jgi:hypothetical protein
MRENGGLTIKQWREMNRALDAALGIGTASPRRQAPRPARAHFVRWRVTYSGPSLGLALLAMLAKRAVERAIAEGWASKPEPEEWHDPWEGIGE